MKILPINNINNQNTQFKAKFNRQDVNEFLREIQHNDADIVPKLYIMLDFIKKQKGRKASIQHVGSWYRILIDGKSINGNFEYLTAFHALQDATTEHKNSKLKDSFLKRISEEEFEKNFYKNSKKTVDDIKHIFEG